MRLESLQRVAALALARTDLRRALDVAQGGAFDVRIGSKIIRDQALVDTILEDVVAAIRRELFLVEDELETLGVERPNPES